MLVSSFAKVPVNCYGQAVDTLVGGTELKSEEGTTLREPLALPFYALTTTPLMRDCLHKAQLSEFGMQMRLLQSAPCWISVSRGIHSFSAWGLL